LVYRVLAGGRNETFTSFVRSGDLGYCPTFLHLQEQVPRLARVPMNQSTLQVALLSGPTH